jgi:hypothetical protein
MEKPILTDAETFPTEEIIFEHINKAVPLWLSLFTYIDETYPEIKREWRYYRDGKSWLLKVTRKSKTIFWLSLVGDSFRTTFYFTDKAKQSINDSSINDHLKKQFNGKSGLRGITVFVKSKKDTASIKELIRIKLSLR